jgi:uncharacterized protein YjbI with pentapeptide repeats
MNTTEHSTEPTPTIEDRQKEAGLEKILIETQLLREQLTPSYRRRETIKVIAGTSGLVLALVGVIGGLLSIASWLSDSRQNRELRIEERLDKALQSLADKEPNKRLAGVVSLRSFLPEADHNRQAQVILALVNSLALEDNPTVQNAINSVFQDADLKIETDVLNRGLKALLQMNRGLMKEGDFAHKSRSAAYHSPTDKILSRIQPTAEAIALFLRKGATAPDMSGVYLGSTDLSGVDLSKYNFSNSVLWETNFTNATLSGANFNGAVLENTLFISADLRAARLALDAGTANQTPESYVQRQVANADSDTIVVYGPHFECADLRGADFSGHDLFGVVDEGLKSVKFYYFTPYFTGANLAGADFRSINVFGVADEGFRWFDLPFPFDKQRGFQFENKPYTFYSTNISKDVPLSNPAVQFSTSLKRIEQSFEISNWRSAQLPRALKELLEKASVAEVAGGDLAACTPRAPR